MNAPTWVLIAIATARVNASEGKQQGVGNGLVLQAADSAARRMFWELAEAGVK